MRENPISFNAKMVNALLSGHKTQTRHPVKNDNEVCRYGEIGDRLWVREKVVVFYAGDAKHPKWEEVPSRHNSLGEFHRGFLLISVVK